MLKAVKVKLIPNKEQITQMNQLLGSCRLVYNACLDFDMTEFKNGNKTPDVGKFMLHDLCKREDKSFLKDQNKKVFQQELRHLSAAFKNFFEKRADFPKFKSKKNEQSCSFPKDAISKKNNYSQRQMSLANIKNIKFQTSDKYVKLLCRSEVKSATLRKKACGIYTVSFLIETKPEIRTFKANGSVGIDLGIKDFIVTSDGVKFENQKFYKGIETKIKRLQRVSSRRKLVPSGKTYFSKQWNKEVDIKAPSSNRAKANKKLARLYEKMKNRKSAYLHQIVNQLLDENQIIAIENLNVSGMLKNHKLAKAIQELSFSEFVRILKYKAEWYGRTVVEIGRFFPSSQLCSECGHRNAKLTLKDREWVCEECGCVHDRDLNASYNILNEGLRLLREKIPGSTGEFTPEEIVLVDDIVGIKPSYVLKSTQSLNQESMAFASCFQ